ncbi:MAG: hypothetical protein J3R72DRAFT_450237 [Linnemannia gamsii]|nr:MAG: hypothetical protein J3R72DRAFT_450237 [Linnemannia gamsii]
MSSSIRNIVLLLVIAATMTLLCLTSSPTLAAPARPNVADVSTVTGGSSTLEKRFYDPCVQEHCHTTCISKKELNGLCHEHVCVCME